MVLKFQWVKQILTYSSKCAKYCFDQLLKSTAWPTKMLMTLLSFSEKLLQDDYIFL